MTGYGRGAGERDGWRVAVEIRSVNHRFLDLKLRGAGLDAAVEEAIAGRIRQRVSRGSLAVSVRVQGGAAGELRVDRDAARRVCDELRALAGELGLSDDVDLALVAAQPGVLVSAEADAPGEAVVEAAAEAVEAALGELLAMRDTEGAALAADVGARLDRLEAITESLASLAQSAPEDGKRRLEERIERLLSSSKVEVDAQRLAQEVAVLADRLDVTEELVRARSHIEQFRTFLRAGEPVGRRLDFLSQELGREYNTVTSKSQSAEIARAVVEAKAELEKIREQVQNLE